MPEDPFHPWLGMGKEGSEKPHNKTNQAQGFVCVKVEKFWSSW